MSKKDPKISYEELYDKYINKKMTIRQIVNETGYSTHYINKILNIYNIPKRKNGPKEGTNLKNLEGEEFGYLKVIDGPFRKNGKIYWNCICKKCNIKKQIRTDILTGNHAKSCGCLGTENRIKIVWKGYEEISGRYWNTIVNSSHTKCREFDITIEYIWGLFLKQDRKCALSGMDIKLSRNTEMILQTASLDRIDSKKGYIKGNVQWVHKLVNQMKLDMNQKDFIKICKKIGDHNDKSKRQKSSSNR